MFLLTGGTFGYSRQIYVPLCLVSCFERGIFNFLGQAVFELFKAIHIQRVLSNSLH